MPTSHMPTPPASDLQRTQLIRAQVSALADDARARHPWLRHQNLIGLGIHVSALAGMGLCAWLYVAGWLPWWATIPLVAMLASLTHETEHDLIHLLYFKQQPWVQDLMLLTGWLSRPSTINPWMRRHMHFHHHKKAGHASDFEERAITNGEPWGLRRLLMTVDNTLSFLLRPIAMRRIVSTYVKEVDRPASRAEWRVAMLRKATAYLPLGHVFWGAWHAFVVFHAVDLAARATGHPIAWDDTVRSAVAVLDTVTICFIAPNVLRNFSLHFISSNMHYYGDVEAGNVMQQTQVLNHPLFWPFQLFCFNFGATHAIHHFVVGQPFYLRQMIAADAHVILRRMGVRFNDLGSFRRANRWQTKPAAVTAMAAPRSTSPAGRRA